MFSRPTLVWHEMKASECVDFNSLHLALSDPVQTPLVVCVASVM